MHSKIENQKLYGERNCPCNDNRFHFHKSLVALADLLACLFGKNSLHGYILIGLLLTVLLFMSLLIDNSPPLEYIFLGRETYCTIEKMDENVTTDAVKLQPLLLRYDNLTISSTKNLPIFFIESSCKNFITPRYLCSAAESFALHNPNSEVRLLFQASYLKDENGYIRKLLKIYKNVRLLSLNRKDIFRNTPLENLYASKSWVVRYKKRKYWNLSDMIRLAVISKFGGLYTDFDTMCLKNLASLQNTLGLETNSSTNTAIFSFEKHHPLLTLAMKFFADYFEPYVWVANGPWTMTSALKLYCNVTKIEALQPYNVEMCDGVTVLNASSFYPIPWNEIHKAFEDNFNQELFKKIKGSYSLHWFNVDNTGKTIALNGTSFLNLIAKENCPATHQLLTQDKIERM